MWAEVRLTSSTAQFVMSQVLAAINHNLQEEYTAIKLPTQGAKDRLLADAKFLYEKLSALKNIPGASTAMLVTVVSEKIPVDVPKRVPANQRIKGMLSRSGSNPQEDTTPPPQQPVRSVSPSPVPTSRSNSPIPPISSPQPMLPPPPVRSSTNGTSTTSQPTTPAPSPPLPPLPSQPTESTSTTEPNGVNGH